MDPARLRLLRELGDRGSVAAVAAAMHVSASAVSQQLAALQATMPVPLTEKHGRRLVLTEAGEALAIAASRVEEALAEARDAVDSFLQHEQRPVSVSAFHSAGLAFFGPLLTQVGTGAEPVATPRLLLADADVAQDRFAGLTADYDLVIAHRLPHEPAWPLDRLVVTPLLVEPLDIAMHEAHPLAARLELRPEDLRDERWISTHEGFPLAGVLHHLGALSGRAPRIDHRINEFSVAAQVVRTGAAIAVMPRTTAAPLAVDGMVLRPVAGAVLVRHVDVLARPEAMARSAVRSVLASLQRVAADATR
ncbi:MULTISPECIES: LysR family transcriptional regulator [unclassified Plantibacter]|uniref:LysR family transcriptional regulator n=1 Tax=unclassified Plantibacter TaxID=2624265 RepID=UPI00177FC275|nr:MULTISPECIES: LysR family transcriptional regulator [unclassified Plantibacter]MBD8518488.1 LysR family transcriptional regulator [Plantibacter sp. CFBP 8804]MBD8537197.1 LysR family transcriptional regulator [Plantibacter sp. CFBP 13570]